MKHKEMYKVRSSSPKSIEISKSMTMTQTSVGGELVTKMVTKMTITEKILTVKKVAAKRNLTIEKAKRETYEKHQQRQQEAAKRREQLLKIPRSKILETASKMTVQYTKSDAVQSMYRIWCRNKTKELIVAFKKLNLNLKTAADMTFEQLSRMISSKECISCLQCLMGSVKKSISSKKLLSAFLFNFHIDHLVSDSVDIKKDLSVASKTCLLAFFKWLRLFPLFSKELISKFMKSYSIYVDVFDRWKGADLEDLQASLIQHFLDLEVLLMSVEGQEAAEEEWKPNILKQQALVKEKLMQMSGEKGLTLLEAKRLRLRDDKQMTSSREDLGPVLISSKVNVVNLDSSLQVSIDGATQDLTQQKTKSFNVELAHELCFNPNFSLIDFLDSRDESKNQKKAEREEFIKSFDEDIQKGNYSWLPIIINRIKQVCIPNMQGLLMMVDQGSKRAQEIEEGLDMHLIKQGIEQGVFDTEKTCIFVFDMMQRLCAPIRDPELEALRRNMSQHRTGAFYAEILSLIEKMRFDLAEYALESIKPMLIKEKQIVAYEREKFRENFNETSLAFVEEWLKDGVNNVLNSEELEYRVISFPNIFAESFALILYEDKWADRIPGTFYLDLARIKYYRKQIDWFAILSSISMIIAQTYPSLKSSLSLKKMNERLRVLIETESKIENIIIEVTEILESFDLSLDPSLIQSVVTKVYSRRDHVFSILRRRMLNAIKKQIRTGKEISSQALSNSGLELISTEFQSLANEIVTLANHNKAVYAEYYDRILNLLVKK